MGRPRRRIIVGIALISLSAVALAGLVATRYYPAYRSALAARGDLQEAQALLRAHSLDVGAADLAAAEANLKDAEAGFRRARRAFDDPLLRAGQHLPLFGDSLRSTSRLMEIGVESALLGNDAVGMARAYQQRRDRGKGTLTEQVNEILAEMDPPMTAIQYRLDRIRGKRSELTGASLPGALVSAVQELDRELEELDELLETYDALSVFLPGFLGYHGPRTYLILAQNNAELLATGGLISALGVITTVDGRIEEQHFEDAVSYGGRWLETSGSYVKPPAPLQRYLLKELSWNLAVSNWSPHFPAAAEDAERFYGMAGGRPVDGVIAINVHTIEELLSVTGPVNIDSYGVTVSAENAFEVIEENTRSAQGPDEDRKAFIGVLAEELLSRLVQTPPERWMLLLETFGRLRDQHNVLFFSHDDAMQAQAHWLGIDGALEVPVGDYLMVVDASVNSTKLNIALDQSIELRVSVDAQGNAAHQATVSYENEFPEWSEGRDPDLVRRLMLGGVYGGYLRLLAPNASQIESVALAGQEVGPEEVGVEEGKAVFGRFFALPGGESTDVVFRYRTPRAALPLDDEFDYWLYLQKQPGTEAIPLSIEILLPEGARVQSAALNGTPVASVDRIETDLAVDRELFVRYRLDR